ncbi:MAG TPA: hypothetical protein VEU97_10950 [Ktedonobacteraceae bacterium]|nr:hypothetical protein [Ktedonobacteraceae bacterium]
MRILMIAPKLFFEPRGVPFCVYFQIKALVTLGYKIGLVIYHMGKQIKLPELRVYRAPQQSFIRKVKIGSLLVHLPPNLLLFLTVVRHLCRHRYHYLHTHEEAGLMRVVLTAVSGCEHLY